MSFRWPGVLCAALLLIVSPSAHAQATGRPGESARAASASVDPILPHELRAWRTVLDRSGRWATLAGYGTVWYPNAGADWRPFADGTWKDVPSLGWTWVGTAPWAWPASHFGRWGLNASGWFWMPGSQWSPAWVAWAVSPNYVGWCPLDRDDRPLVNLWLSSPDMSPWRAWTVVPRGRFHNEMSVVRWAVSGPALARVRPARFLAATPAVGVAEPFAVTSVVDRPVVPSTPAIAAGQTISPGSVGALPPAEAPASGSPRTAPHPVVPPAVAPNAAAAFAVFAPYRTMSELPGRRGFRAGSAFQPPWRHSGRTGRSLYAPARPDFAAPRPDFAAPRPDFAAPGTTDGRTRTNGSDTDGRLTVAHRLHRSGAAAQRSAAGHSEAHATPHRP